MKELDQAVAHQLSAALGWMELGNPREALAELEGIPEQHRNIPAVIELRWMLYSCEADWEKALQVARELLRVAPENAESWLHHAYALRRAKAGGLQAAWEALSPALEKFPKEATVPYNLACYACQMGNPDEARTLLARSFKLGRKKAMKQMALADADLEELWEEIKRWE